MLKNTGLFVVDSGVVVTDLPNRIWLLQGFRLILVVVMVPLVHTDNNRNMIVVTMLRVAAMINFAPNSTKGLLNCTHIGEDHKSKHLNTICHRRTIYYREKNKTI